MVYLQCRQDLFYCLLDLGGIVDLIKNLAVLRAFVALPFLCDVCNIVSFKSIKASQL